MGLEAKCEAIIGDQETVLGKLHLDSAKLEFSGKGQKWECQLNKRLKVKIDSPWLVIGTGKKAASFHLNSQCEKWKEKIENPPTRFDKLAIKPEQSCLLSGRFDPTVKAELKAGGIALVSEIKDAAVVLAKCEAKQDLTKLAKLVESAPVKTHFWIVWPKGVKIITQSGVMDFANGFGMGPSKSCSFDEELSAMRFMKK